MSTKVHFFHGPHDTRGPHITLPAAKTATEKIRPSKPVAKRSQKKLHRVATVRREQEITLRAAARKLNCRTREARLREDETRDLSITELMQWQKVLNVPLAHLLEDPDGELSSSVFVRAKLVQIMKTVAALFEQTEDTRPQRLVEMLKRQLVEVMPELESVNAWHSVGQRKGQNDFGRVVENSIDDRLMS